MVLPIEYFETKTHITDLQKLKDRELYFIIRLFYHELENFNKSEGFHLIGLNKACNKMNYLIKDIRFILNGYMDVINENNLSFCSKPDIERLLIDMVKIEIELKKIKAVRLLKKTVNDLVNSCLLNIRLLYSSLSDFIFMENHLWEA